MKAYDVVGWTYNAAIHCPKCAQDAKMDRDGAEDREGNEPHPIFAGDENWEDETCDDCGERLGDQ